MKFTEYQKHLMSLDKEFVDYEYNDKLGCGLAEEAMFNREQKINQLLSYGETIYE